MASPIARSTHPSAHWPGMQSWFGHQYSEEKQVWSQIFTTRKSEKAHEEIGELFNFGLAGQKPEGEPVIYDVTGEGKVRRFVHCTFALAYVITEEAKEDNLYKTVGMRYSKALGRSMRITKEMVTHSVLNNAFDDTYVQADGTSLIAPDHPMAGKGSWSNMLPIACDLSEVGLEDLMVMMSLATDARGLPINLSARKLVIPPHLQFEACRILDSTGQSYTDSNNVNVLKAKGMIPEIVISRYLTDPNAYFLLTDVDDGLILFQRTKLSYAPTDRDFNTGNHQFRARERYSVGVADPRSIYGSAGS